MKQFRFPKGVGIVYVPFWLHELTPWQNQLEQEKQKFLTKYKLGKSHCIGFQITENGASIVITKN